MFALQLLVSGSLASSVRVKQKVDGTRGKRAAGEKNKK